jgi:polyvinyl alcohol dehydrogenase (cytochrome)
MRTSKCVQRLASSHGGVAGLYCLATCAPTFFAVDAETGKLLWKTHAAEHPASIVKGAPTLAGTTLYVPLSSVEEVLAADPRYQCCTFRGDVTALDAETGKLLWQGHAIVQAPQQVRKDKLGIQLWGPSGQPYGRPHN